MFGFGLAIFAGFCAAMASLSVKLALSPDAVFKTAFSGPVFKEIDLYSSQPFQVIYILRILLFILTFIFNGLMWTLFVKSLQMSSSSAQAMVTNNGSNFIFSAFFGKMVFGEVLSLQWWCGASFIILGLFLINRNTASPQHLTVDDLQNIAKKDS